MKRTTYIFIDMLVSTLVILIAGVVYISSRKSDRDSHILTFPDKLLQTEFPGVRAVEVYVSDTRHTQLEQVCVNVVPSTDGKTRLFSPESEYLKISQDADTLVIYLDLTSYNPPEQKRRYLIPGLQARGLQLTIETDANLAFLTSTTRGLRTSMSGVKADSLATHTQSGKVRLDSCEIHVLYIDGDGVTSSTHQSIIPYLYLGLDGVRDWGVHECTIGTEHLTGGETYHHNEFQKGGCKKMIWTPKKEDAVLHVAIKERGCLVLQDE